MTPPASLPNRILRLVATLTLVATTIVWTGPPAHAAAPVAVDDAYSVDQDTTLDVDWWNSAWSARHKLSFSNQDQSEDLLDFPVLIVLNSGNIDFGKVGPNGVDLRFVDGDGKALAHEIELWDESGDSYVWVNVPRIDGSSNSDFIWMYYDNGSAGPAQDADGVWNTSYQGVWHMHQDPSGTVTDSSGNGLDLAFSIGMDSGDLVDGTVGKGAEFDSDPNYLHTNGNTVSLTSFTLEAWVRPEALDDWRTIMHIDDGGDSNYRLFLIKDDLPKFDEDDDGSQYTIGPDQSGTEGNWRHLAVTYNDVVGSNRLRGYLNGDPTGFTANPNLNSTTGRVILGSYWYDVDGNFYDFWDGTIDEVRISDTPRSADWVKAQHLAMTGAFVTPGGEEPAPAYANVVANDTDGDGDSLTAVLDGGPSNALSFTLNVDGSFTYTPNLGFRGVDTFTYKANDGSADSNAATVTITVGCSDSDSDGLCDLEEDADTDLDNDPSTNPGPNTDGDATPNYLDADDDGDGTPTASENADPNSDGDPRDAVDSDWDGQPDYLDLPTGASDGTVGSQQKVSDLVGGLAANLGNDDNFGNASSPIGDIDGDGTEDLAVAAVADDDGGTDRGSVYILFLNPDGTVKAEQKISDSTGGLVATLDNDDRFGKSVGGLGDLDGDGIGDLAVGAYHDDDGGPEHGAIYILFLNADGSVKAEQKISDTAGGLATPLGDDDYFGESVAGIGDLDGDGVTDLLVGAYGDDDGGTNRGAVYVLFLNSDGTVKAEQKISDFLGGFATTLGNDDRFGMSVAGLGDLDGDGLSDIAVGAYFDDDGGSNRGAVYILFLNANGTVKGERKISDTVGGLAGPLDDSDYFGRTLDGPGDIDLDGIEDLVVGAHRDDDGGADQGAVYVLFLNTDGTVRAEQKISPTVGGLTGSFDDDDRFGRSVTGIGDLGGDGLIDLAVGAYRDDDGGSDAGAVYVLHLSAPSSDSISGTVFEDIAGDVLNDGSIGDGNNPGSVGVDVYLYEDTDGNNALTVGFNDTLIAGPVATDGSGAYSFSGLPDETYFVVVDSRTMPSAQAPATPIGDIWADQTYGPAGGACANGLGSAPEQGAAGPCYGGITGTMSDSTAFPLHRGRIVLSGSSVSNVDFGFSFNVVTNTRGGDATDDDGGNNRTVQGSLRQFIQNANAIAGPNVMRFVPVEPTDATDGTNTWWRISITNGLPYVDAPATTIDGSARDLADGMTIRDTNPTVLGTGGTVGVDGLALPQVAGPELELLGDLAVSTGLGVSDDGDNSTVRRLAISQFFFDGLTTTGGLANKLTGVLVEDNVLGSGPSAFVDPGAGNRQYRSMYAYHTQVSGTIRNNLIGFAETTTFPMTFSAQDLTIEGNEIRGAVYEGMAITYSGSQISGDITVRGNLIDGNGDAGLSMYRTYGSNTVENNTITNNGATYLSPGVNLWGTGNSVTKNIITGNSAAGIAVAGQRPVTSPTWSASNNNLISQNLYGGNGGVAIDLVESTDDSNIHWAGDGITLTPGTLATTGNNGLDAPAINAASLVTVAGTSCTSCDIEVYKAVAGAGDTSGPTGYGEGIEFLGTTTADGAGDWSLTGITGLAAGDEVSAIAIDGSDDTSEFGANVTATGAVVVNSTGNLGDSVLGDGVCDTGGTVGLDPECTLRAAIGHANATAGDDVIEFDIPVGDGGHSGGVWTITPSGSALPPLSTTITIDGTTQSGYVSNTTAAPGALDGTQVIVVDGGGLTADGLTIDGDDVSISGLVVNGFDGRGIVINGARAGVSGVYVGTDGLGTTAQANTGHGIQISGVDAVIGGLAAADRVLVSGNGQQGIEVTAADATIRGAIIGLDATTATDIPNGRNGIRLNGTTGATIGSPGGGNVVSGNNLIAGTADGIYINGGSGHTIQSNLIGTNDAGAALGNFSAGIAVGSASGVRVGGTGGGEGNVISGNGGNGVTLTGAGATGNFVEGNYIGTNPAGSGPVPNNTGVAILSDAGANIIGGSVPGAGNVISGNTTDGVRVPEQVR